MILRLTVPDAVYEVYVAHAKGDEDKVPVLMAQQLELFRRVFPGDRVLVVDNTQRGKLEALLPYPGPHIADAKDLIARVEALAAIEIGGVRVDFNQRDLAGIASAAEKNGLSVQEAVAATVEKMKNQFISYLNEATAAAAMLPVAAEIEEDFPPAEQLPTPPQLPPQVSPRPQHPAASSLQEELEQAGATEEGFGRLLNPAAEEEAARAAGIDPTIGAHGKPGPQEKIQPRPPGPAVHGRRRAVVDTPAASGGEVRPAGWGAGSRG